MSWIKNKYNFIGIVYTVPICILFLVDPLSAQQGGDIFERAACNLMTKVLTEEFGALLTVLAGLFALVSSVVGAFRMAWVLVFVSVGIYLFPKFVYTVFPTLSC